MYLCPCRLYLYLTNTANADKMPHDIMWHFISVCIVCQSTSIGFPEQKGYTIHSSDGNSMHMFYFVPNMQVKLTCVLLLC